MEFRMDPCEKAGREKGKKGVERECLLGINE